MCLILFAHDCHPRYRLVLASNRDEFYCRPALPAAFWPDNPQILAGKDLQAGGTWLGVTTTGLFAALTNFRDPSSHQPQAPSRGALVHSYLCGDLAPAAYLDRLQKSTLKYNGFNLLVADLNAMYYYSNLEGAICAVEPGVHGLSNSLLNTDWPKVHQGKKALIHILQNENINIKDLLAMMKEQKPAADDELPNTGVGLAMEKMLSPIFISSDDYGTKSTTVILIDHSGHVCYWERSFIGGQKSKWQDVSYNFQISTC